MCVSDHDGIADFLKITGSPEMLSGLLDKYDPRHMARVDLEINRDFGSKEIIPIAVCKLSTILKKHDINKIDFLSIDTEGSELNILKGIDYDAVHISIITVENNFQDHIIRDFLKTKGFRLLKKVDHDDIYISTLLD